MPLSIKVPLILSTGGYNDQFLKFLSLSFRTQIVKCHEYLQFVIKAIDFLNKHTNDAMFKLHGPVNTKINQCGKIDATLKPMKNYFSLGKSIYPYLLLNMRSGASFIRIDGPNDFHRVAGSSIGVSLAWGVTRYLGIFEDPTEMCSAAVKGDSSKIDMSVGDIYGGDYKGLNLSMDMIASSFGRLQYVEDTNEVNKDDIARSLLTLIAANNLIFSKVIAASEKIKRVIWIGQHIDTIEYMHMSESAFAQFTNQEAELMFPTYHSFLGSLGLLLSASDSCVAEGSPDCVYNH